jgi:hypothetical protein
MYRIGSQDDILETKTAALQGDRIRRCGVLVLYQVSECGKAEFYPSIFHVLPRRDALEAVLELG